MLSSFLQKLYAKKLRPKGGLILVIVCTLLFSVLLFANPGQTQSDSALKDLMEKESRQQNPCHVAQTIINKITEPLYKFRGVSWNKREWAKWRNELAHGQDISARYRDDWVFLQSRELGGPGSPAYAELDRIKAMAEAIHNLYNSGYDCAHNASNGETSGFLNARKSYKQSLKQLRQICPSLVVPDSPCKVASDEAESDCKCPDGSPCLNLGPTEPQCPSSEIPRCQDMLAMAPEKQPTPPGGVSKESIVSAFGQPFDECSWSSGSSRQMYWFWKCSKPDGKQGCFRLYQWSDGGQSGRSGSRDFSNCDCSK